MRWMPGSRRARPASPELAGGQLDLDPARVDQPAACSQPDQPYASRSPPAPWRSLLLVYLWSGVHDDQLPGSSSRPSTGTPIAETASTAVARFVSSLERLSPSEWGAIRCAGREAHICRGFRTSPRRDPSDSSPAVPWRSGQSTTRPGACSGRWAITAGSTTLKSPSTSRPTSRRCRAC
jgi:hypothetical protein